MSAFADPELLADFLAEAGELLEDVDIKLVELEKAPEDAALLNAVYRGFHTVKGGAGFLDARALVELCHRAENLLDGLRNGTRRLTAPLMDRILAATAEVRRMFGEMSGGAMPTDAPRELIAALESPDSPMPAAARPAASSQDVPPTAPAGAQAAGGSGHPQAPGGPDWQAFYDALLGRAAAAPASAARPAAKAPPKATGAAPAAKENTLRVDTARFDQILTLSGEIGLAKNRLNCLRAMRTQDGQEARDRRLEAVMGELDVLVTDLQSAVMKARMQPVGRVFQKYTRLARDLSRGLGKDVELLLAGEDTEIDKTILEELNDPLVHLVRNAVDHGADTPDERRAAGKPPRATVRLSARQEGDHIVIEISDDGRGMDPAVIRAKAVEKGLLEADAAGTLDARQSLQLIFLPGFSTKTQVTDVSGRGVGMDVVATSIRKLKGRIEIDSRKGGGTRFTILLPLTLAILPVAMLRLEAQTFAMPLANVQEMLKLDEQRVQEVGGRPCLSLRGEVLPLKDLAALLGRTRAAPAPFGVLAQVGDARLVLAVDALLGQEEVMVKPLGDFKPRGVAGATISGDGALVLVLELQELLAEAA